MKNSILQLKEVKELSAEMQKSIKGGACPPGRARLECGGPLVWVPNICAVPYLWCEEPVITIEH
ncbi:hypothetical protein [Flavobacterium sp. '19STA2R22 D10 B1']|uniref:hypothetical protein n=1 Tax=Flavobacterium aerium TaxID=3037261 RepID=UPI00278C0BDB|nr:hypothetical protein [Flavobacterium sp. '19STA2R22 D10 B1']